MTEASSEKLALSDKLTASDKLERPYNEFVNKAFELDKTFIEKQVDNKNENATTSNFMDFDDLLPHIGEFGRYQKILFLLMIPYAFFLVVVYFTQMFITLVPEGHWCMVPELQNLSLSERLKFAIPKEGSEFSKCSMYAVNWSEISLNEFEYVHDTNRETIPCSHGWEYNRTEIHYATIATQLDWVCADSNNPTYAQSIFFCGAIVGGLLFGWIADRYGRIPALVGTNIVGAMFGIATGFSNSFWTFAICRFFVGFAFDSSFTIMYILVLEYVGPSYRTFIANMSIALFFGTGACLIPWIAFYINDWQNIAIYTSVPLLLSIFTPWIVPESARWLVSRDKIDRALQIIRSFERINGKSIDPAIYKTFTDSCTKIREETAKMKRYSILDLFKTPRLRKITILLILFYMSIALVFDGYVRNIESIGYDPFIAFTLASATELPASSILTLILDRWGRRWLGLGTMVLCGCCSLIVSFLEKGHISTVVIITGRFFINFSYNIGMQYAAESLPTVVRAQGVSFIHIMGYVATIMSPIVVSLNSINQSLPLWILGFFGVFGGVLALFLPETLGKTLPQTLDDGEQFGLDQKFFDFPCITRAKDIDDEIRCQATTSSDTPVHQLEKQ